MGARLNFPASIVRLVAAYGVENVHPPLLSYSLCIPHTTYIHLAPCLSHGRSGTCAP
jgi:hypothetical protein